MLSACAGNSSRSLFLEHDGVEASSEGRLKTAGCRMCSGSDLEIEDFDDFLFTQVLFHSITEAGRAEDTFSDALKDVTK